MSIWGVDVGYRRVMMVNPVTHQTREWFSKLTSRMPLAEICATAQAFAISVARPGDLIAVELPVVAGARNIQSSLKVAMTTGAVMAGLRASDARIEPVEISTWKKVVCGNGGFSKEQVTAWVREHHPQAYAVAESHGTFIQDACDAFCIGLWAQAISEVEAAEDLGG